MVDARPAHQTPSHLGENDLTIVEEQATGQIVSSLNHISQTWTDDGIPFKVGRPELVGTLPEYRHKRLVQGQFDEIHRWIAERGEIAQVITGIPYYYKRFDYELGLELGGGQVGFAPLVPTLKEGESKPFSFRPAAESEYPVPGQGLRPRQEPPSRPLDARRSDLAL